MASGGWDVAGSYKNALQKNHSILRKTLDVCGDYLSDLYSNAVLTAEEYDMLIEIAAGDNSKMRDELLKLMRTKSEDEVKHFIELLEKNNQMVLAKVLMETAQGLRGRDKKPVSAELASLSLDNKKNVCTISSLPREMQNMNSWNMPPGPHRTILVLGKTGQGKSFLCNNILGVEEFESKGSPSGVTIKVKKVTREVRGRKITVVDTPGTMDPKNKMDVLEEIAGAIAHCPNGYDAFIIVLRYPLRFTEEQDKAISKFQLLFGDQVGKFGILVFTGGDTYRKECKKEKQVMDFSNFVDTVKASENEPMRPVFDFYKGGWLLVDNFEMNEPEKHRQMNHLIKIVDEISEANGKKYDTDLFEVARKAAVAAKKKNPELSDDQVFLLQKEKVKIGAKKKAGGCFPSNSVVTRFPGEQVAINKICEGDQILVMYNNGKVGYDTFYMQGHNDADTTMVTVTLTTINGQQLTASDGHFIYVSDSNTTKRMCDITLGDYVLVVYCHDNKSYGYHVMRERIIKKEHTTACGMYNPMTLSGTIVVDNIIATNYEKPLYPAMAHTMLAPIRGLYSVAPGLVRAVNSFTYHGIPAWAYGAMAVITWLTNIKRMAKFTYGEPLSYG